MAPPMTVASEQNATVCVPSTVPVAASMPRQSSGVISCERRPRRRTRPAVGGIRGSSSRGSLGGLAGFAGTVVVMRAAPRAAWAAPSAGFRRCGRPARRCGPPKPNELLSAAIAPSGSLRGLVAMSSSTSSSTLSRLIVGGTTRWCSASTVAMDSSAPAAPSRCPVIDLVEVSTVFRAASPSALIAFTSATSPSGVDVAWALMCMTSRAACRSSSAILIARAPPSALGIGLGDVVDVGGDAGAGHLGVHPGAAAPGRAPPTRGRAPRRPRRARSRHGPCPTAARRAVGLVVAPRQRLHLREGGHRQRVDRRLGAAATTTSARPSRIMSSPSAIPSLPDAQADTGVCTPARAPIAQADVGRRPVRHQHRDRQRRDPARPLLVQRVVVGQQGLDAADA